MRAVSPNLMSTWTAWFPILHWGRSYDRRAALADVTASAVVTLLLIPQALAYAVLAGLPPVTGLWASMLPMVIYALMCSSTVLGPGPTALRSMMSLAAAGSVAAVGSADFAAASALLALLVGVTLLVMGALRLGFVAHVLSRPVLAGFMTAAALLIAMGQVRHLLGVPLQADDALAFVRSLWHHAHATHGPTLAVGVGALGLLLVLRRAAKPVLVRLGVPAAVAGLVAKAAPLWVMLLAIALSHGMGWAQHGVAVVGEVPRGLPPLTVQPLLQLPWSVVQALLWPALLMALLTFVEQISIAQDMAARRREPLDANAEMRAMGAANVAAGLSAAFNVGASFGRTAVVADAGGRTPAVGLITAVLLALTALYLTPLLHALPMAVLAAIILTSLGALTDWGSFVRHGRYARADLAAQVLTFATTLLVDLLSGLAAGVLASLLLHVARSSRPHIAVVGNVPGTEHYRNVLRHPVVTQPHILGLRVDESLFFANAPYLEQRIIELVARQPQVRHVVLQCSAINAIDTSALESLRALNDRLGAAGVRLHLSEVKGPVMDQLQRSDLLQRLSGQVFLTHHQAVQALAGDTPSQD
ncbi:putative sulfate transporter [Tepidimonas aquatica]|uniref:Putative sulfate transporter n=2 Tax=Tepidimonas aquatica TaxID=247482 RepID=A0A554WAY0_9BURK|nr:putative sulfate transporter [Tepidimonas aquatica]